MSKKNKTLVEVGHLYLDEILNERHKKPIDIYQSHFKDHDTILMVDDLNIKIKKTSVEEVKGFYHQHECFPIEIGFESSMTDYATQIIPKLSPYIKKHHFRKDEKDVYFLRTNNTRISLFSVDKNNETFYTCALLSLCWCLYKSGYFDGLEALKNQIVIIPKQYEPIESNVKEMLNFLNIEIEVTNYFY